MKDAGGHGSNARGGDIPVVRLDNARSRQPKTGYLASPQLKAGRAATATDPGVPGGGHLSSAAGERIAKRQGADEGRNPPSTITDRMAAMSLGQGHPKSDPVPLGSSFSAAKSALDRGRTVALPRGAESRRKS